MIPLLFKLELSSYNYSQIWEFTDIIQKQQEIPSLMVLSWLSYLNFLDLFLSSLEIESYNILPIVFAIFLEGFLWLKESENIFCIISKVSIATFDYRS